MDRCNRSGSKPGKLFTRGLLGPACSLPARGDWLSAEPEEALRRPDRGLAGSTTPSRARARAEHCGSSQASRPCICRCLALRPYTSGSARQQRTGQINVVI
jgi:hypothetical protein